MTEKNKDKKMETPIDQSKLNGMLVCDDCGKQTPDVKETLCPLAEGIYNDKDPCTLCDNCYNLRSDEI